MSPKQKKIAAKAPPPDKIDGKDFAVLKAEKAKGRGMGLQDESVKPGKVMKARTGKMVPLKKDPTKPISSVAPKVSDALKKKKLPGRVGTALGVISMLVPAGYAAAKQYKDYKSAKNRDKAKVKKMVGGMAKKYSVGGGADMSKKNKKSKSGSSVIDIFKSYGKYDGKPIELSKGGGADTGRMGEIKSKISVAMDRASRRSRDKDRLTTRDKEEAINIIRRRSRDEDRLTNRDIETASSAIKGYTSGGKAKKSKPASPQSKPENKYNSGPDLRPDPDILGNRLDKKLRKYYGSKETELHSGYKNDKRPFPDTGEDRAEMRATKEVLQEAGIKFKTGGSVMARGCKLGRNKKTKLY